MRPFFKQYRNEQLVCCVTCGIRRVRGVCGVRGAAVQGRGVRGAREPQLCRACTCGQQHRTSNALDARVKRAGQTLRSNARQSKHNFKVRRYVFCLPRTRPRISRNLVFAALLSCLHCFADGRTHLCQIICQKDVYITLKIAKTCRISSLGVYYARNWTDYLT